MTEKTMTIEELEKAIFEIADMPFRIDITARYLDKTMCVDFGRGIHFENSGMDVSYIFKSVLAQIQGYFNERN